MRALHGLRRLRVCRLLPRLAALALLWSAAAAPARAQDWYPHPITAFDGRFAISGDATATIGADDTGYFNYTDYDHSALRLIRFDAIARMRASNRVSFLLEMRAEGDTDEGNWTGAPYAAYVQLKPFADAAFDVQVGRVATAFGAFPRRSYAADNLLIGYPLAYQYLTSLRPDALPANADQLLAMRGSGWLVSYPVGASGYTTGVSPATVFRYDTGVVLHGGSDTSRVEGFGSITTGTLSNPGLDRNGGAQVAGRIVARPVVGLLIGGSLSRGRFLDRAARQAVSESALEGHDEQRAFGVDAEYSRAYWLVRTEVVGSQWRIPAIAAPFIDRPLGTLSWMVEGRYKIVPGLYAAARYDTLSFSTLTGSQGTATWDANAQRLEFGIGYSVTRTIMVKGSVQRNHRESGRIQRSTLAAGQVIVWF